MKLAIISQPYDRVFAPSQNSIGLIIYYTALEISRNIDVVVYTRYFRECVNPSNIPFAVKNLQVNMDRVIQKFVKFFPGFARFMKIDYVLDEHRQYRHKVIDSISRDNPDIVHLMNYWNWCREIRECGSDHKIVLEMHCEWLSEKNRDLVNHQLQFVDAVFAVSNHIANTFTAAFPNFPGLVATVGNGVDVTHFKPREAPPKRYESKRRSILFVGRISPEKGVHTLVEAFRTIAGEFEDVDLVIAGPHAALSSDFLASLSSDQRVRALLRFYDRDGRSSYRTHLETLVSRFGLQERVRFLGNVAHKDLLGVYQASDVVVNPSLSESFGISVVEAMACGVPVVGTRIGGMCETILSGVTGILVDPDAPTELADALTSIFTDSAGARRMGAEGRKRAVECYSWRARADRVTDLYQRLAKAQTTTRTVGRQPALEMLSLAKSV